MIPRDPEHYPRPGIVTEMASYLDIRRATLRLAAPLSPDDCQAQSLPEASPVKWHLAHTTWFFAAFVLGRRDGDLFNSYYESLGSPLPRTLRAALTRPSLGDVLRWREEVDAEVVARLESVDPALIELGLNHEQQHQELILTDLKHLFWTQPSKPAYAARRPEEAVEAAPLEWLSLPGGWVEIGADAGGFSFDHERPRHRRHLEPFSIASRPVNCGEYLEFMRDGGYARPELWLSDGWDLVRREGWRAPLYWMSERELFTLSGPRPIDPAEPLCHVSWFEADAYARWAGARLPLEEEWEHAAASLKLRRGVFLESGRFHPAPQRGPSMPAGVWEWTSSAYLPYPGYRPPEGSLGEYNGKFMSGRMVLRGGSCATPESHVRAAYRNYFPPETRWQFSGLRLAREK